MLTEVSAAGILCLEHFYTKVKSLLVAFRENATQPQDLDIVLQKLLEVESLRVQRLWLLKKLYP